MKTPSEYFNKPVIGKIITSPFTFAEIDYPSAEYEVIGIQEDVYFCNQWNDSGKLKIQLVHHQMVETYEPYENEEENIK